MQGVNFLSFCCCSGLITIYVPVHDVRYSLYDESKIANFQDFPGNKFSRKTRRDTVERPEEIQ
jgi:hypothetical protein